MGSSLLTTRRVKLGKRCSRHHEPDNRACPHLVVVVVVAAVILTLAMMMVVVVVVVEMMNTADPSLNPDVCSRTFIATLRAAADAATLVSIPLHQQQQRQHQQQQQQQQQQQRAHRERMRPSQNHMQQGRGVGPPPQQQQQQQLLQHHAPHLCAGMCTSAKSLPRRPNLGLQGGLRRRRRREGGSRLKGETKRGQRWLVRWEQQKMLPVVVKAQQQHSASMGLEGVPLLLLLLPHHHHLLFHPLLVLPQRLGRADNGRGYCSPVPAKRWPCN